MELAQALVKFQEKELYGVRFVPLIGKEGWKE